MIEPLGLVGALLEGPGDVNSPSVSPGSASLYPQGSTARHPEPMAELFVRRGHFHEFAGTLYAADRLTPVGLSDSDAVQVTIGRTSSDGAVLSLSQSLTANGSAVYITSHESPATLLVVMSAQDTAELPPGVYLGALRVIAGNGAVRFTQEFLLHVLRSA